jgi:tetratricopeptide (TPR) repeat protein
MGEYLFTGRNADGKQVTERIEADSADTAVRLLTDDGYLEIVLHTDDVGARYTRHRQVERHISPREYVRFRGMSRWGYFLYMLAKLYRKEWIAQLGALAMLAFRWQSGWPFGLLDILALVILLFPLPLALAACIVRAGGSYERLVEAASWARWDEVLRLLPRLPAAVAADEKAFRKAAALAGLGRLDEALEVVKPLVTEEEIPAWLYWNRLSGVYTAARDREQAFACLERAASLAPDNATMQLDWALALLRRKRDVARAEEIVQRVKTHALSDIVMHFLHYAEGILALEKGKPYEARELLQQALAGQNSLTNPVARRVCDILHAYLCLAEAGIGNYESARRHFDQATPRLKALREDDLLARCDAALGN